MCIIAKCSFKVETKLVWRSCKWEQLHTSNECQNVEERSRNNNILEVRAGHSALKQTSPGRSVQQHAAQLPLPVPHVKHCQLCVQSELVRLILTKTRVAALFDHCLKHAMTQEHQRCALVIAL